MGFKGHDRPGANHLRPIFVWLGANLAFKVLKGALPEFQDVLVRGFQFCGDTVGRLRSPGCTGPSLQGIKLRDGTLERFIVSVVYDKQ